MRHIVTFIIRLWVDPEDYQPTCEGQIECLATGEQTHIRNQADAWRFIDGCLKPVTQITPENDREQKGTTYEA